MVIATPPANESQRLAALHDLGLLDSGPEESYDDLARMAANVCGTPVACISLIDAARQYFKARVGIDVSETPRDVSFCSHAILHPDDLTVVPDATTDERFADNPLVVGDPKVRFYASTPLVDREGHALGTLCVLDFHPRTLTLTQQESLASIGRQVMQLVELRRRNREQATLRSEAARDRDFLMRVLEATPAGLIVIDRAGQIITANAAADEIIGTPLNGRSRDEETWRCTDASGVAMVPCDMPSVRAIAGEHVRNQRMWVSCPNGRRALLSVNATPLYEDGEIQGAVVGFTDITHEQLLHADASRYQLAVDSVNHLVLDWNVTEDRLYCSDAWRTLLGAEDRQTLESLEQWLQVCAEEDRPELRKRLSAHVDHDDSEIELEHRLMHSSGYWIWVLARLRAVARDENGRALRIVGTVIEITARKLMEVSLEDARHQAEGLAAEIEVHRERLSMAVSAAGVGLWDWNINTGQLNINEQWATMLGHSLDELEPHISLYTSLIHPEDFVDAQQALRSHLDGELDHYEVRVRMRHKDGSYRWVMDRGRVTAFDADGKPTRMAGTHTDITDRMLADQKLTSQRLMLETFINHTPAAVAMFDSEMKYLATSQRWTLDYKLNGQELIGRSHYDVFPEVDDNWKAIHAACLAGERRRCDRDSLTRANGQLEYLQWEIVPWFEANGQVGGIIVFTQVITEAVEAERRHKEQSSLLSNILSAMPYQVFWKDLHGRYLGCNNAFAAAVGLESQELIRGRTDYDLPWSPEEAAQFRADDAEVIHSGQAKKLVEQTSRALDGSTLTFLTSKLPLLDADGRIGGVIGVAADVTPLQQAREQHQLAKEEADRANRSKSEFLANMSHELRTPMTAILGFADLLADAPAEERKRYVSTIRRNGEHLLAIINDVLDLSKIEAGRMSIEHMPCNLAELATDAIDLFRPAAATKGLQLSCSGLQSLPTNTITDPMRIRQVLTNLLGNAIKFTDRGAVSLHAESDGQSIIFSINDTGLGMSEQTIARLFKPFMQADTSTTRRFGGTGLGLTICRQLARMLDGEIEVSSVVEQGTTFRFRLPRRESDSVVSPTVRARADASPDMLRGLRVLLAEDGKDNQVLVTHILGKAGLEVTVANNGQEAVDAALASRNAGTPFDLILMDMQMPVLDGYAATAKLRQHQWTGPIVALTAHAMHDDRVKCINAGCDDYATKPLQKKQLLATMAAQLSGKLAA